MTKLTIDLEYDIGEKIEFESQSKTVIGIEYVPGKGLRYILLRVDQGRVEWDYMYEFEIKFLTPTK